MKWFKVVELFRATATFTNLQISRERELYVYDYVHARLSRTGEEQRVPRFITHTTAARHPIAQTRAKSSPNVPARHWFISNNTQTTKHTHKKKSRS